MLHPRPALLPLALLAANASFAAAQKVTLNVAVFPSLDQSVKAILPAWQKVHPDIEIKMKTL